MIKIFEKIPEIIGWIQIMISPTLIGIVIGLIVYYNFQNKTGLIISCTIVIVGFCLGIRLATRKFKTTGTINFLTRISASPEIDSSSDFDKK